MRIIQTVNDTIRLLFNPKTEIFSLSDFLLVRDCDENFLAQVVEVYDDKFDQEANVAKIKLIYRIKNGNEIAPYDNYTPSRECEVAKIKQKEIEKCINLNKKTIVLGKSAKTKEPVRINTDFIDNECIIFADKFEQTNQMFENLAPRLSECKNVLILDFSGTCQIEGASNFVAGSSFRIPFCSKTVDYIQQKTLLRAKLETQVILGDVFEEVKEFLLSAEEDYLPFIKFIKVIQQQCKKTPAVELLVLISWLKKYAQAGIFAKHKREFDPFFKAVAKNKTTILDMSNIKTEWQKEYLEYIVNNIEENIYLFVRLNDNNINNDILNNIYLKRKNITFIPSFSYGYKKATYIMEFAKNYILMPTLNPKKDFSHANFQIQSLNQESFMIFGEDTKDFIFTFENEATIKKQNKENEDKDKLFVSLNLQLEDMTPLELRPNNFEVKQQQPRKKRLQEEIKLIDILKADEDKEAEEKDKTPSVPVVIEENEPKPLENEGAESLQKPAADDEEITAKDAKNDENNAPLLMEEELDYIDIVQEEALEQNEAEVEKEAKNEARNIQDIEDIKNEPKTVEPEYPAAYPRDNIEAEKEAQTQTDTPVTEIMSDNAPEEEAPEEAPVEEAPVEEIILEEAPVKDAAIENIPIENDPIENTGIKNAPEIETEQNLEQENEALSKYSSKTQEEAPEQENELAINDDILDAIDDGIIEIENNIEGDIEGETEKGAKADANLPEAPKKAEESSIEPKEPPVRDEIDEQFDKIMQEAESEIEAVKNKPVYSSGTKPLPVFDEENKSAQPANFKEGDSVIHEKYGAGNVLKVINYGSRCLLHIEFQEVGKKLLDPNNAGLKPVKEVV